jgi:hypothetical protein
LIPIKNIKKFDGFTSNPIVSFVETTPIYRYILDLGLKGRYIVNSEIPSIRRNNNLFELNHNRIITINPIRVIFREPIGDSDIRSIIEWPDSLGNIKVNSTLQRVDPLGLITEQWLLFGCRPSNLIVENFEPLELTLHIDSFTIQI